VQRARSDAPITVLTTAYNAAGHIAETLDSVRAQTFPDWEHIVVDDASDDETCAIVERYAHTDDRFRLIRRRERGGPYAAANTGLADVHTRYVARLDSDDICAPHRFERQLAFLSAHPSLRACAGPVDVLVDGALVQDGIERMPQLPGSLKWALCVRWLMPSTALVETDAFRAVGGYVELPASQDHRLWCELSRRGWLGLLPEVLVHWRSHPGQISTRTSSQQHELGIDVVRDHLHSLGLDWTREDISMLRRLAHPEVSWGDGMRVLQRFRRAWESDATLLPEERAELERFVRAVRRRHMKVVVRERFRSAPAGRFALDVYHRAHDATRSLRKLPSP